MTRCDDVLPDARDGSPAGAIAALSALVAAFALSQAFRTMPAIIGTQIGAEFQVGARELGFFAGVFHAAFALMQVPVGVALDRYGPGRTVGVLFLVAALGAVVAATATDFRLLVVAQALLGVGCSPALMAAMVYVALHWPTERFAAISGLVIAVRGLGMLAAATPLAFIVEHWSWRTAFGVLAVASALATAACWLLVRNCGPPRGGPFLTRGWARRFAGSRASLPSRRQPGSWRSAS